MDSGGNSGSMQSSSTGGGGDEAEYDSSSHANFFHVGGGGGGVSGNGGGNSLQQQQSSLFDSLSNFLTNDHHDSNNHNNNPFSPSLLSSSSGARSNHHQNSSSILNLDILLQNPSSSIPRSQLNNFNSLMTSSAPSPQLIPGRINSQNPSPPINNSTDHYQQANISNQPNRNPKKRSRASRRAPTTVLTTDTSNFRAMVQEFTGIPTQPFSSSSSLLFPRGNRLDLFSNSSSTSTVRSGTGGGDSSFLLRPFAQKPIQVPPFLSSTSSMVLNSSASTSAGVGNTNCNPSMSSSSNANNIQLLSDQLGFPSSKNNQTSLLNMQKYGPSLIPYQSLVLQSNNPTRNENHDTRANTSTGGSMGLPNLVTSDGLVRNASSSWEDHQDHVLRSLNGNYNNNGNNSSHRHQQQQQQRVMMNADKGSTTSNNHQNATRGEGMVDSWICSSSE